MMMILWYVSMETNKRIHYQGSIGILQLLANEKRTSFYVLSYGRLFYILEFIYYICT